MLFNSPEFLLIFLPLTLVGYYWLNGAAGSRTSISFLVLASLFFYGWWNPLYILLIVGSIVANFAVARAIWACPRGGHRARGLLTLAVMANLATLGFFKYANFFLDTVTVLSGHTFDSVNVVLPLAISFFTFQQIAFLVDVFRHQAEEAEFVTYSLFVTFFPQLIAGPIVHHAEMMGQFKRVATEGGELWENLAVGATIIAIGLFKKVVLAEKMGFWADQTFGIIQVGGAPTLIEAWIGMACFTFQIYFDFSGYSDMAIGLARMFGIRLPLNFDSPYKASNIVDFWRRWHMTLSRFLRDYLYFPLGGNRKGKLRRYGNLMTVMALGGLWHGAGWTFVLWGVVHGFYLIVNHAWWALAGHGDEHAGRRLHMARRWGGRLLTFVAVAFSWVLFRAESLADAMVMYRGLFGLNGIVLPTHYEPMLSSIGGLLAGIGVTFGAIPAYGGGWQLIWVFAMLLLVWLLPSTQELMHRFAPALDFGAARRPRLLGFALPAWRPSLLLGVITGIVMLALTIKLLQGQPGEFIYFQF